MVNRYFNLDAPTVMRVFILEDSEERVKVFKELFKNCRVDYADSCAELHKFKPPYDLILLDHDLGDRVFSTRDEDEILDTGYEFVKRIKNRINSSASVVIHSYNDAGARAMLQELEFHKPVLWEPFGGRGFTAIVSAVKALWEDKP